MSHPFTPTTMHKGGKVQVADTRDDYQTLLWEGWTPDEPAPLPPAFSARQQDELSATIAEQVDPVAARVDALPTDYSRAGAHIAALGDSITVIADESNGNRGYLNYLSPLSGGRAYRGILSAQSGAGTGLILSDFLPTILAADPKPDFCVLLAGTNDLGGFDAVNGSTIPNLIAMYTQLRDAGIEPIACTVPPHTTTSQHTAIATLNQWITTYARTHNIALAKVYDALVEPATGKIKALYDNGDGIHPSNHGAAAIGRAIITAIDDRLPNTGPDLAANNVDPTTLLTNPLFLTDSDANGTPDGWVRISGTGEAYSLIPGTGDVLGNVWRFEKTDTSGSNVQRSTAVNVTPGDVLELAFRASFVATGNGQAYVQIVSQTGVNQGRVMEAWKVPVTDGIFYFRITATETTARVQVTVNNGAARLDLSQMKFRNLTALGIA